MTVSSMNPQSSDNLRCLSTKPAIFRFRRQPDRAVNDTLSVSVVMETDLSLGHGTSAFSTPGDNAFHMDVDTGVP